jgi:hypothetical protein
MTDDIPNDEIEKILESGFSEMYRAFFRLRGSKQYQREYDAMGTVISLLMTDREFLRNKYKINP